MASGVFVRGNSLSQPRVAASSLGEGAMGVKLVPLSMGIRRKLVGLRRFAVRVYHKSPLLAQEALALKRDREDVVITELRLRRPA